MEELKKMCEKLEGCAMMELAKDKCDVDTHELGEVFDMIKDIKEAIYYGTITEAMEDPENVYGEDYDYKGKKYYTRRRRDSRGRYMYTEPMMMEDEKGVHPYSEHFYEEGGMPDEMNSSRSRMRDMSGNNNRMYYTDSKMMKHWYQSKDTGDDNKKLQSLEKDLKEISEELTSMVGEMNNSEKQMLRTKMQNIVQSI